MVKSLYVRDMTAKSEDIIRVVKYTWMSIAEARTFLESRMKPLYIDLVIRWGSLWLGAHYSPRNRSVCIALLPCIVIRIGRTEYNPDEAK